MVQVAWQKLHALRHLRNVRPSNLHAVGHALVPKHAIDVRAS